MTDITDEIDFEASMPKRKISIEEKKKLYRYDDMSIENKREFTRRLKKPDTAKERQDQIRKDAMVKDKYEFVNKAINIERLYDMIQTMYGMDFNTDEGKMQGYKIYSDMIAFSNALNNYIKAFGENLHLIKIYEKDSVFANDAREVLECIKEYVDITCKDIGGSEKWDGTLFIPLNVLNNIIEKRNNLIKGKKAKPKLKRMSKESGIKLEFNKYSGEHWYGKKNFVNQASVLMDRVSFEEIWYYYYEFRER
jgi:hypothetical protein